MKQKPKDYKEKRTSTPNGWNMKRSKQIFIISCEYILYRHYLILED